MSTPDAYAYSQLQIKSIDAPKRIIEGWASTPTPDRVGDIMEPAGAEFALPLPLLWQHDAPIGQVFAAERVDGKGIYIKARVSTVSTPGRLKEFVDDAWASFSASPPLVRGLSIGWRPLEAVKVKGSTFTRHLRWLWVELSGVTIPANAECSITNIKSFDIGRAATGTRSSITVHAPGDSGSLPKRVAMSKNYSAQIESEQTARDTKSARLDELITKDGTEGGLDADESKECATLTSELEGHATRIRQLKALEGSMVDQARPTYAAQRKADPPRVEVVNLPKGTAFTRYAMAVAAGKGSLSDTIAYAKRFDGQTPEVTRYIKAVAGSSVAESPGWGAELVYATNLASEFAELLRPMTIVGRIDGFRRVPFNVRVVVQTGGSTVNWVGEKAAKPVSELDFTTITMGYDKIAGIVVLTEELVRLSSPSAEETVRRDLTDQIAQFMDEQFITPSVAAGANNPASVTNGVTAIPASGTGIEDLFTDINHALSHYDDAGISTTGVTLVTTPTVARGVSALRNSLGVQDPQVGMTPGGGSIMGFPVIVSDSVPSGDIVFIKASEILLADDGRVTLDSSNQATLDMAGGNAPTFNLWQKNCIGIRAERWVTWKKRRTDAVQLITGAAYAPA
jgi:HK97 family phage major capsid protein